MGKIAALKSSTLRIDASIMSQLIKRRHTLSMSSVTAGTDGQTRRLRQVALSGGLSGSGGPRRPGGGGRCQAAPHQAGGCLLVLQGVLLFSLISGEEIFRLLQLRYSCGG